MEKKQTNWLVWAGVGTVIYASLLIFGLGARKIWAFIFNPRLNEFGDFLAGVFAPLALIWLVAAVLTQRQELDDARVQFKKSQKVTDQQLENVQKQNEFAAEQAQRNYKLSLFEPRFVVFEEVDRIARRLTTNSPAMIAQEAADRISVLAHRSTFIFSRSVAERLMGIAGLFQQIANERNYLNQATIYDEHTDEEMPNLAVTNAVDWADRQRKFGALCDEVTAKLSYANRTVLFEEYLTVTDARTVLG